MADIIPFHGKREDKEEEDEPLEFFQCSCGCGCFFVAENEPVIICADCGEGWASYTFELQGFMSGSVSEPNPRTPSGVDGAAECPNDDYGSSDQT
jgi:hypothetical protein|tara:strand:- start:695 stop:979 length:285 start_codon:yes stop_codon:yes gene_type:complete